MDYAIQHGFSEEFFRFISALNGVIPPVPLQCIDYLEEIENNFFVTVDSEKEKVLHRNNPLLHHTFSSLDVHTLAFLFENHNAMLETTVANAYAEQELHRLPFCALGLRGHGIQNNVFVYLFHASHVRIGISIPYGNAFTFEDEQESLESALRFAQVCQQSELQGKALHCTLDATHCEWRILHEETQEILHEGTELAPLLDLLVSYADGHEASTSSAHWVMV